MRLLVICNLFLAPTIAFSAPGEVTYRIVKPGKCPTQLALQTGQPDSAYKNHPGRYYVYALQIRKEDLINPSKSQVTTHRRVTRHEILPNFEGRTNVVRQETYFENNPVWIRYSVTENGTLHSWNDAKRIWIESKSFPEMAEGLEFVMQIEGVSATPCRYRGITQATWGSKQYSDIMALDMENPQLLTPQIPGKAPELTTRISYWSKDQGFIGFEDRRESRFTDDEGVVTHTQTIMVETLVEISDKKPAGLAEEANP